VRNLLLVLAAFGLTAFTTVEARTPLAGTETPNADSARITRPDWKSKPSGEDMARYFPERAQRQGVEGRATIACSVEIDGALSRCEIVSENPAGYGFGEAALKISGAFRMKPQTLDGIPVAGGEVNIPIVFKPPPEPAAPSPPDPRVVIAVGAGLIMLGLLMIGALLLIVWLLSGGQRRSADA
jgi:TonB family protein